MTMKAAWAALWAPETKANAGPLVAMHSPGRALWSPRRFDSFAEEGYRRNVIAYRAVNQVARAAASVPWRVFQTARRTRGPWKRTRSWRFWRGPIRSWHGPN